MTRAKGCGVVHTLLEDGIRLRTLTGEGHELMAVQTKKADEKPSTDRIEKKLVLRASRSRVWRAIANAEEFGTWFRMNLDGEFAEGATIRGRITHPGYEHVTLDMRVERIEPERYFSYRWHPYAIDPAVDYSAEPTTLVEFTLEDAEGGTALTIVESGFDRIPLARRAEAFRMNDQGWAGQIKNLERYVS
jgi:uncharacterized protein YndB with AHSA1/START domain